MSATYASPARTADVRAAEHGYGGSVGVQPAYVRGLAVLVADLAELPAAFLVMIETA